MSKLERMNIRDILNELPTILLTTEDFKYIFKSDELNKQFKRLYAMHKKENYDISIIEDFLVDNVENLDKENLILVLAKNCKYQLEAFNEELEKLKNESVEGFEANKRRIVTINEINKRKKLFEETQKQALRLGRGMNKVLTFYYYNKDEKRYMIDVIDSRKYFNGEHISKSKNLKRIEKIDKDLKEDEYDDIGIGYILQVISLSDLQEIFPDKVFATDIIRMVIDNKIIKDGLKTKTELEELKRSPSEYTELIEKIRTENFTEEIREVLKEYAAYVDIDKLLLISGYRFNYGLNCVDEQEKTEGYEEIVKVILNNIENENARIDCVLEYYTKDKVFEKSVEYSAGDLEKFSKQFVDNRYVSDKMIESYKEQVSNGDIKLKDIDQRYIDIIFTSEELEEHANLDVENFSYVVEKLEWDKNKILQIMNNSEICSEDLLNYIIESQIIDSKDIINLYLNKKISLEQIDEIKNMINLSNEINSTELIQYYKNSVKEDSNKEDKEEFDNYAELYKEVVIKDAEIENLQDNYDELINELMDNYKGNEYVEVVKEFYQKGLVNLEVLIEWNEEKIIDEFYNDGVISLKDIESLVKSNKLSFEYISNLYKELIDTKDIDYDERLDYIKTGFVSERDIFKLYEEGYIFEKDLRDLAASGIVRVVETEKLINNRTKEDLEKKSSIKLLGLNELSKINNDIYANNKGQNENFDRVKEDDNKVKLIIDPNKREKYINMFNATRAETDLEEDSPFYNYEFYVIPDESGEIGLNSVVIAERYYDNKDTEEKFALNNATYFFKYKDLMVLSNLKKSEMTKERKNVVFTAKHILADENKTGYWGAGVIYGIVKTMLSDDLNGYKKEHQRNIVLNKLNEMYGNEEILEILDMASEIDRGNYTYEIVNPEDTILRKTITKKKDKNIVDDTIR